MVQKKLKIDLRREKKISYLHYNMGQGSLQNGEAFFSYFILQQARNFEDVRMKERKKEKERELRMTQFEKKRKKNENFENFEIFEPP